MVGELAFLSTAFYQVSVKRKTVLEQVMKRVFAGGFIVNGRCKTPISPGVEDVVVANVWGFLSAVSFFPDETSSFMQRLPPRQVLGSFCGSVKIELSTGR